MNEAAKPTVVDLLTETYKTSKRIDGIVPALNVLLGGLVFFKPFTSQTREGFFRDHALSELNNPELSEDQRKKITDLLEKNFKINNPTS